MQTDGPPPAEAQPKAGALIGRLWRDFLSHHKTDLALLAPALILVALAGTSYSLILKWTIDQLNAGDFSVTTLAPLAVIVASGIRGGAIWAQAVLSQGLGLKVLRDLQTAMFSRLNRADFARFGREETGRLVSRFTNDINVVSEGLVRGIQAALRDALILIGALASMLWYDWVLTLLVIAIFGLAGPPLARIATRARRQTAAAQAQMGALTGLLNESLGAARMIRTYGLEEREDARALAAFEERRKLGLKLARNRARTDPLLEILGGVALAGVLFVAGMRIASGAMTVGDFLGAVTAVGVATPAARAMSAFNTILHEALAALTRVFGLLDEKDQVVDAPAARPLAAPRGRIALQQVQFSYGAEPALHDISFVIEPGETVALVGPSGAGKSTIFNLIPRLYDVTGGRVLIDGQDVRDIRLASLRQHIALVAQDATIFNDTARTNIALGRPGASEAEIVEAARAAAAHDFLASLPQGYDTILGERGGILSGGERQRVALARAFLRDAPILLLDEATSALDAQAERVVQNALDRLANGRTTLVIAHRLATVRNADRILVLSGGGIVESGRHDELLARDGLYARLCRLQFAEA